MKRMSIIIICGLLAFNFTSCCTKVGCLGAYYKEIIIVLRGVGFHSSVEEYDKNSGQLVLPNRVNMNFLQYNVIRIGDNYAPHPDSFFLNQRYFIIHTHRKYKLPKQSSYRKLQPLPGRSSACNRHRKFLLYF